MAVGRKAPRNSQSLNGVAGTRRSDAGWTPMNGTSAPKRPRKPVLPSQPDTPERPNLPVEPGGDAQHPIDGPPEEVEKREQDPRSRDTL